MKWLIRILGGLLVLAAVAVVTGVLYQRSATASDEARFPMPGERVDIGGRALHIRCTGEGPVTVVLENGLTANYSTWLLVQPRIAQFARVCSYDRAGMGWSDPSPDPTQAEFVSRDLAQLLGAAGLVPPYLIVGWSAGGVFARRFQREHPDDVAGLVFVDSSHEQQRLRLPKPPGADLEAAVREQLTLCDRIDWTGAVRLSGAMAAINARLDLPEAVAAELLAMSNRNGYCAGVMHEMEGFPQDLVSDRGPGALGDLPLVVLTRGRPTRRDDFPGADVSADFLAQQDRVWSELQTELAALSTRAVHRIVPESGHAIPLEAPATVVDAVRDVLQSVTSIRARAPSAEASHVPSSSS
jgi:pimeloyl-ACP methyl ester carboxylesterase